MSKNVEWERYSDPNPSIIQLAYFKSAKKVKIEETAKKLVFDKLTKRPKFQYKIRLSYNGKKASFKKFYDISILNVQQKSEAFRDILRDALLAVNFKTPEKIAETLKINMKDAKKMLTELEITHVKVSELFGSENIPGIYSEFMSRLKT